MGAWLYVLATSTFGLSSSATLLACSLFPLVMLAAYFMVLPNVQDNQKNGYQSIDEHDDDDNNIHESTPPTLHRHDAPNHDDSGLDLKSIVQRNLNRVRVLLIP